MSANLNRVVVRRSNGDLIGQWDSIDQLSQANQVGVLREGDLVWGITHRVVRKKKLYQPKVGDVFKRGPYAYQILHVFDTTDPDARSIVTLRSHNTLFTFASSVLVTYSPNEDVIKHFVEEQSVMTLELEEVPHDS